MRLKSFFFVVVVMLLALTETLSAQTARTFGARKFLLDDGTGAVAGLVYLTDLNGSLGVDLNGASGLVNGFNFPSTCALLDLSSTTKGFLTPRMTNAQELGICSGTPPEGLIVYNLTNHTLDVFNGSAWGPVSGWQLRGNSISLGSTVIGGSYIGTNTAQDFVTATAGVERTRVMGVAGPTQGFMGIGTATPNRLLEVTGVGGGAPSARFGSLGGAPLVAPPLVATDGIVIANNTGDVNKYGGAFVVGTFAWLRTGNTISDGNNMLGTLNDIAIDFRQNGANVMTVGTVAQGSNVGIKTAPLSTWPLTVGSAGVNSIFSQGNTRVDGTLTSAGNSTIGTNAGTTNTFGNSGGATINTMGQGAAANAIGTFAAVNTFGNNGGFNQIGANAGTNQLGNSTSAIAVVNNIGQATFAGGVTTNTIGTAVAGATSTNAIGSLTGSVTNTIQGTTANAITLDVNSVANNLVLNNIAQGLLATDINFLVLTNPTSGSTRWRTLSSFIIGSEGVDVTYVGGIADAHFGRAATGAGSVPFVSPRFINTNGQILHVTSNIGGAGTDFVSFNGGNDAVGINNLAANTGATTIGNTTAGANVQINSAGTGTSAVNTIALNGTTNINTVGAQSRTTVGNGAGAATQLLVNGAVGGLVGAAPFTNGPDNGWDMHVAGDQQITGTLKIGTASIIEEGVTNTITGYNANGLNLASGNAADMTFRTNTSGINSLVMTAKGTGALPGSLDFPQTISSGPGVITMAGTRYIHAFGTSNFFAGAGAGNLTLNTGLAFQNTGIGSSALPGLTTGANNTGIGASTLVLTSTGSGNTAVGYSAASFNNGSFNTAIGSGALFLNTTSGSNVAIGVNSLFNTNTVGNNTAVGTQSGQNTTTGSSNTFIGSLSGLTNVGGFSNTILGANADVGAAGLTNATVIGANAVVTQSNSLILGNTALPTSVGIGINAPTTILDVRGSTTVVGATNINSNNASTSLTNIGSTTNTSAVTIASNSAAATGAIVLDVANVANSLRFNNIAAGANTDAAFLDISAVPSGQVRTRTIQSMVTGSNGVSVEYPGTSVADAHFADANNKSVFVNQRFINIGTQNLSFTGGGANTTFINFNGANNGVDINNTTVGNNNIGNGGGTTINIIGATAFINKFGNSSATNEFGVLNVSTNNFGGAATSNGFGGSTALNAFGNATFALVMNNSFGTAVLGSGAANITNAIGQALVATATVNNNIGSTLGTVTNTVLGTTNINATGNAGTTIGHTGNSSAVTIASNFSNAATGTIIMDIGTTDANHNLRINNLSSDALPTNWLSINGSNQVRITPIAGTALEGIVYSAGAYRLGSTLTSGAGSNPFLVNRNVNLDAFTLNFTSNNGTLTPFQIIGGAIPQVNVQAAHNVNTGAYALTRIGNGSNNHQLEVIGTVNALITDALASPTWDLAVTGDIAASGIIKSGASIAIDGVSPTRRLISDGAMTISTDLLGLGNGGDLTVRTTSPAGQLLLNTTGGGNISLASTGGNGALSISTVGTGNISMFTNGSGSISVGPTTGGQVTIQENAGHPLTVTTQNGALSVTTTGSGNASFGTSGTGTVNIQGTSSPINITSTTGSIQTTTTTGNITFNSTSGNVQIAPNTTIGALAAPNTTLDLRGSLSMQVRSVPAVPGPVNATDYMLLFTDNSGPGNTVLALPGVGTQGRTLVIKNLSNAGGRTLNVTPPAGIQIDNGGAGTSFNLLPGGNISRTFTYDAVTGQWYITGN